MNAKHLKALDELHTGDILDWLLKKHGPKAIIQSVGILCAENLVHDRGYKAPVDYCRAAAALLRVSMEF